MPTRLFVGTEHAKVGLRDPQSDDPEQVRYYRVPGRREIEFGIPEDIKTAEAFAAIIRSLRDHHLLRDDHLPGDETATIVWVECEDKPALAALLAEEFGDVPTERPAGWEASWEDVPTDEALDDAPPTAVVTPGSAEEN